MDNEFSLTAIPRWALRATLRACAGAEGSPVGSVGAKVSPWSFAAEQEAKPEAKG